MSTGEQYYRAFEARTYELFKRGENNTLDKQDILDALQGAIEGIYPYKPFNPPSWWLGYEVQTQKVQAQLDKFKCALVIPNPPKIFCPRTTTEVPVLTIDFCGDSPLAQSDAVQRKGLQRTLEILWDLIELPGYTKRVCDEFTSNTEYLQSINGIVRPTGVHWRAVDVNANGGCAIRYCWDDKKIVSRLSGSAVLMMCVHFPDWITSWDGVNWLSPNLAGYQFRTHPDPLANPRAGAPFICRDDESKELKLGIVKAEETNAAYSSPMERDLAV
jgi:hypothetical protein